VHIAILMTIFQVYIHFDIIHYVWSGFLCGWIYNYEITKVYLMFSCKMTKYLQYLILFISTKVGNAVFFKQLVIVLLC